MLEPSYDYLNDHSIIVTQSFVDLGDQGGCFKIEVIVWGKKQVTLDLCKICVLVSVEVATPDGL